MDETNYMSKFELGCIVFNSLSYKLFTRYTEVYSRYGGSAAWITALFSGTVFLVLLRIVLKLYSPYANDGLLYSLKKRGKSTLHSILSVICVAYFIFSLCYALYLGGTALKNIVYVNSPMWFIFLFFGLCAVFNCIFGKKAIRRLHSLNALYIGLSIVAISLLSFRYADGFNLTPVLGKGAASVFGKGMATLFMYSDIAVIFFLPKDGAKYSFSKTVMRSAFIAVAVNVLAILALSLNTPPELSEKLFLPLYPLTKTANLGKLPARLDIIYQVALIASSLLYISLALHIIVSGVSSLGKKAKKITATALSFLLCLPLCGCYDSREVEEKAYVIALGIDKGTDKNFSYTFQISNPLESGGTIGADEKDKEGQTSKEPNKTVDNIIIDAPDYHSAMANLRSHLSKEPDVSHIKLIIYSFDVARDDTLYHSELLLKEREIRPGTNLCLALSAKDYLLSVKPTLEETTVRYYELFTDNRSIPHAPVTELRDFVGRSLDEGFDAVIPIVGENGLSGMGIFSNGSLKEILNGDDVILYKLLQGEKVRAPINGGISIIEGDGNPKIRVEITDGIPRAKIKLYVKVLENSSPETAILLKNSCESLLYRASVENCDIIGIGRYLRKSCLTQSEWDTLHQTNYLKKCKFEVEVFTEYVNNIQNLQNI